MSLTLATIVIWDFENIKNNNSKTQIDVHKQKMLIERNRGTNITHVGFIGDFWETHETRFTESLRALGFEIKLKKPKKGRNKDGTTYVEVDMDAEIVHFLLTETDFFSTVIMISGDGDMLPSLLTLQDRGKVIEVFALKGRLSKKLGIFKTEYLTGFKIQERDHD